MELENFTKCKILKKGYGGKNGNKQCRVYNNELYMVKFPVSATINKNIHYSK